MKVTVEQSEIGFGKSLSISFQRTLRIPDDGRMYPLPPGLGKFPIHRVDDYSARAPRDWEREGGVFIPMYQREALWVAFGGERPKPHAVKIGVGKINVISGEPWDNALHDDPQDYLVTRPGQTETAPYEMEYQEMPNGKILLITPKSGHWLPGLHQVDVPSGGMFDNSRLYYTFVIDEEKTQ